MRRQENWQRTPGFRSRCTKPLSCMKPRPSRIWELMSLASLSGKGLTRWDCRSPSSRYSMVMKMESPNSNQPLERTKQCEYCARVSDPNPLINQPPDNQQFYWRTWQ